MDFVLLDVQPPLIECPKDQIIADTAPGKNTARVTWSIKVSDNSVEVEADAVIKVTSSHPNPYDFPIGLTNVRVSATDKAGNTHSCSFDVIAKGII